MNRLFDPLRRALDFTLRMLGALFLLLWVSAALGWPWHVYGWLGRDPGGFEGAPDIIVLMGGGGIPSESGLMRTWQAAREASRFPKARVLVAHPIEAGENEKMLNPVIQELILRGVSERRILREGRGRNTREQALQIRQMFEGSHESLRLLIVTSPEHMRRSILSFRKAGFRHVRGRSVEPVPVMADLTRTSQAGDPLSALDDAVGQSLTIRYRIWDNLGLTVRVSRELAALAYYKLKGWI